jgi:hypothetical protein
MERMDEDKKRKKDFQKRVKNLLYLFYTNFMLPQLPVDSMSRLRTTLLSAMASHHYDAFFPDLTR